MVTQAYNSSNREAEVGGLLQVHGQPELHREALSQKSRKKC